jgi:hypothetical protein
VIVGLRPEGTTSHLTNPAKNAGQVIGYDGLTQPTFF